MVESQIKKLETQEDFVKIEKKSFVIELKNIDKFYYTGVATQVLFDINLQFRQGSFNSIVGPSGSGKSTLMNLIGTLDKPTKGEIYIDGKRTDKMTKKELAELRNKAIGFVFQFYNLIPVLTAAENIELPLLINNKPVEERVKRVDELLSIVGLSERANHKPEELSGGEQQRIAIARALANRPSILLADEPTGDLDEKTGLMVVKQLIEVAKKQKTCLLIVTHDPIVGEKLDRVLKIRDGRLEP